MCGIAGVYNFDKKTPDLGLLKKMGNAIAHRGPDHDGYYTNESGIGFCHRRLSIIDLSAKGNQPMADDDETIWLVFNGEIYNYKELREDLIKKGYVFKSKTDTEVIIKCYEEYGIDCVKRFNGMFVISLWDTKNKRFFAARDRIGIKPFYYYSNGNMFVFASEIKSILVHPEIVKQPNDNAITNYLLFDNPIDNQTWFKNIYSLDPGSYLIIEDNKLKTGKYWNIEFDIDYSRSYNSFKEELRETVIDSVRSHWQSDVPVGAHLSGGVDSSTIVSIASKVLKNDLHTFSSAFDLGKEFDERKEIDIVTKDSKTHHHQISIQAQDLKNNLSKIIYHMDEPVVGPAILPMYRISELVKNSGVTVVNGGQGVDEMFGGYKPYFSLAARNLLSNYNQKSFPVSELLYLPSYLYKGGTVNRFFDKFKKSNIKYNWIKEKNTFEKTIEGYKILQNETSKLNSFEKSSYVSMRYYLPALLHQEDRMSMAWSIESRVPMLDNRIIDLSLKIPSWYKVSKGMSKSIFRESVRGIVPDPILDNKIKRGYPTPTSVWFGNDLYDYMHTLFTSQNFAAKKYVHTDVLIEILKEQKKDVSKNISFPLWKALVLNTWLEVNFENNILYE
jgi:asparagine synthase (glutamine-hydrolysing)